MRMKVWWVTIFILLVMGSMTFVHEIRGHFMGEMTPVSIERWESGSRRVTETRLANHQGGGSQKFRVVYHEETGDQQLREVSWLVDRRNGLQGVQNLSTSDGEVEVTEYYGNDAPISSLDRFKASIVVDDSEGSTFSWERSSATVWCAFDPIRTLHQPLP